MKKSLYVTLSLFAVGVMVCGSVCCFAEGLDKLDSKESGLLGFWKLNDAEGMIAKDFSGNGRNATLKGGVTWDKKDVAASFDGESGQIDTGYNFPEIADQLTISIWVKPGETQTNYADILGNHADGHTGFVVQQEGDKANVYFFAFGDGSGFQSVGNVTLIANKWQHLVITYNGKEAAMYIDGTKSASKPVGGKIVKTEGMNVCIGLGYIGGGRFFKGLIKNVRIYSKCLAENEIGLLDSGKEKK